MHIRKQTYIAYIYIYIRTSIYVFVFFSVAKFYHWTIFYQTTKQDKKANIGTFLIFVVIFLSNFFFGLYACILSALMLVIKVISISSRSSVNSIWNFVYRFIRIHLSWLFLTSWWILGCLIGYRYIGGLPWRTDSEDGYSLLFIINMFMNGEFFDSGRYFPWLTILVLLGFTINNLNLVPKTLRIRSCTEDEHMFSSWLVLSSFVSTLLFLGRTAFSGFYNLIPFHTELETVKYLNAIHFCGLLHASTALTEIFSTISEVLVYIVSVPQYRLFMARLSSELTWENVPASLKQPLGLVTVTLSSWKPAITSLLTHHIGLAFTTLLTWRLVPIVLKPLFNMFFNTVSTWKMVPITFKHPLGVFLKECDSAMSVCKSMKHQATSFALLMVIIIPIWYNHFTTIGTQLTMTEVDQGFIKVLQSLKNSTVDGRILGHKGLGNNL